MTHECAHTIGIENYLLGTESLALNTKRRAKLVSICYVYLFINSDKVGQYGGDET